MRTYSSFVKRIVDRPRARVLSCKLGGPPGWALGSLHRGARPDRPVARRPESTRSGHWAVDKEAVSAWLWRLPKQATPKQRRYSAPSPCKDDSARARRIFSRRDCRAQCHVVRQAGRDDSGYAAHRTTSHGSQIARHKRRRRQTRAALS